MSSNLALIPLRLVCCLLARDVTWHFNACFTRWELSHLKEAQSRRTTTIPSRTARGVVTGSDVAYRQDWCTYVVLAKPKQPHRVCVLQGPGTETWLRLEKSLPGGQLFASAESAPPRGELAAGAAAVEPLLGNAGAGYLMWQLSLLLLGRGGRQKFQRSRVQK